MPGETAREVSGWTIDTAMAHMQKRYDDLESLLDERYQTQTKAVDAAFSAQQLAMTTALAAAERAVQTALVSAEKAVIKAEAAADKRFESVNEFRQTLTDQANTFVTRVEHDSWGSRLDRIEERLNVRDGRGAGLTSSWGYLATAIAMAVGISAIIFAVTGR
jgi:cytochrome c5